MGRRFESYFQETEIAQWVEQFTQTVNLFFDLRVPLNKKLKSFLFKLKIYFLEMNLKYDQKLA